MKKPRRKKKPEEISYWQSYSDMMAALLLVFVLIIAFTISHAKADYDEKERKLEEQRKMMEKQEAEIAEFQKQIADQSGQIDKLVGIRSEIVRELTKEFKDSNLDITIDPETGTICFDSKVLFNYDESSLKRSGIRFLNTFFPKYFDVILKKNVKPYIAEVIIEGHTDDKGSYLYNLNLSQRRAFAVAEYCLGDGNHMFSKKKLEQIRQIVTANGRSYYELKYHADGRVDAEKSRRVEIKFRLTEEDMMKEISSLLNIE